jgi:hypothetical protein
LKEARKFTNNGQKAGSRKRGVGYETKSNIPCEYDERAMKKSISNKIQSNPIQED